MFSTHCCKRLPPTSENHATSAAPYSKNPSLINPNHHPSKTPSPSQRPPADRNTIMAVNFYVHSSANPHAKNSDFVVRPIIDGEAMNFYVLKRPSVDEFLESLSKKFEIVVFTAGLREYAPLVLDIVDKNKVINRRLYRDSCRELDGKYVKDLAQMGRDLRRVVLFDDNPNSYAFQPEMQFKLSPLLMI